MTQPKANNFQRIRALPRKHQAILSLMLLERMLPNYQLFVEVTSFPQPHKIDNIMNSLWERLLVHGSKLNFGVLEEKVEQLTPNDTEYDMYGVFPAIYFCTGLLTYIAGEIAEDDIDAVAVAKVSQGCIVHLLEYQAEQSDVELNNDEIRNNDLMQAEINLLNDSLDWLEGLQLKGQSAKDIKQQAIAKVQADGVTNIGIAL